ncbi:MAG: serine/threonine-protein kinase [Candidatus Nanopelagicales bacterium]
MRPPRIGRYQLTSTLGRGAMGVVYLGYDEAIDRQVAIKTIHRTLLEGADGTEWLERFRREVRAAGRCLHPNIVTVFEYGEENGVPYIVMEYVQGRELRDYLKDRRPLPLANAVAVVVQVLHALDHAHACGVVHRDIKPGNIILLADGQVKVSDFGIARVEATSGMTQHGMTVGTPGYMAPEQFGGQEVDRRADLYATGVVLFEALTGTRPFAGRSSSELMYKVLHDPPPRVTMVNPRLPPELNAVLDKALAKAPDERFQDANRFIATLESLRLVELEVTADGSTLIRVAPVQAPGTADQRATGLGPGVVGPSRAVFDRDPGSGGQGSRAADGAASQQSVGVDRTLDGGLTPRSGPSAVSAADARGAGRHHRRHRRWHRQSHGDDGDQRTSQPDERVAGFVRSGYARNRPARFGGLSRSHRQGAGQASRRQGADPAGIVSAIGGAHSQPLPTGLPFSSVFPH